MTDIPGFEDCVTADGYPKLDIWTKKGPSK